MTALLGAAAGADHGEFSLVAVAIGAALLIANGFFVAAEIALLAARRGLVEEASDRGEPGAQRVLDQLTELSVTFTGAQLGITMCSLGLGLVAEPAVAALFSDVLQSTPLPAGAIPTLAFLLGLFVVVFLHMVVGEMAPKNLALARAEQVAFRISRVFVLYSRLFRPLIVLLNGLANALVRLVRVQPVDEHRLVHTPDELTMALIESGDLGTISAQDARVMSAALRLSTIHAEAAMTPRIDMHALPDTATRDELLALASETGHTRFPIFHGDVDHVVGVVHVKDALRCYPDRTSTPITEMLRPIPAVSEFRDLEGVLQDMLDDSTHAVVVVDEHGGTAGLLTLEDVLEELVGDIADEFDDELLATRQDESAWIVPGLTRRDEAERLTGLLLAGGDAETVSGTIVELLGRLPRTGDRVLTPDGWTLTVLELDGLRAAEVEIRAPAMVANSTENGPVERHGESV